MERPNQTVGDDLPFQSRLAIHFDTGAKSRHCYLRDVEKRMPLTRPCQSDSSSTAMWDGDICGEHFR